MHGWADQSISRTVAIRAKLDRPLTLEAMEFNLDGKVAYTLEEVKKGERFQITFRNVPGPPAAYKGLLKLKTNYPEEPVITIWIRGRFIEAKKTAP